MRRDDTLRRWFTLTERAYDRRTGAVAEVFEDAGEIWIWKVHHPSGQRSGESSSRKSARAAARKYVRSLDAKPEKQLKLF